MSEYIGQYSRPDGYAGNMAETHLVLHEGKLLEVYYFGFHRSPYLNMDIVDKAEALFLINVHPNSKYS